MKHPEFRALETNSRSDRTDDVFAGAVAAFCSLTRPLRQDIFQLEELAMPLLARASPRAKRRAAASLSELPNAPKGLVAALACEPVEISAPLLLRSPVLTPIDLIGLVHRCGLAHARIIACRRNPSPELAPDLARLLENLEDPVVARALARDGDSDATPRPQGQRPAAVRQNMDAPPRTATLGGVRSALRDIMEGRSRNDADETAAALLIRKALDDNGALFETALADSLGVGFARARRIVGEQPGSEFFSALKALGLSIQDAYFVTGLVYGIAEASREALRDFARSFTAIEREAARATVRRWKAEEISDRLRRPQPGQASARMRGG